MQGLVVFDLDGTLIDSLDDLAVSVNEALRLNALPLRTRDEVRLAIGHGALRLIHSCLPPGTSPQLQEKVFEDFLEHYNAHCALLTKPYDGVVETLVALEAEGWALALLTNKPEEPTRLILRQLGLARFFGAILGGDSLPVRKPDPAGLWWLMGWAEAKPSSTWMIGDSSPDFGAASAAGVRSIGYESGLALPEAWSPAPDYTVQAFPEIRQILGEI